MLSQLTIYSIYLNNAVWQMFAHHSAGKHDRGPLFFT